MTFTICLDIDGVLIEYWRAIVHEANKPSCQVPFHGPKVYSPEDEPTDYCFVLSGWFDSTDDFLTVHREVINQRWFASTSLYTEEVFSFINYLNRRSNEIHVVITTSRLEGFYQDRTFGPVVVEDTFRLIQALGFENYSIAFTSHKQLVDAHLYIDDSPSVLATLAKELSGGIIGVFDRAYNQDLGPALEDRFSDENFYIFDNLRYIRYAGFSEVVKHLDALVV